MLIRERDRATTIHALIPLYTEHVLHTSFPSMQHCRQSETLLQHEQVNIMKKFSSACSLLTSISTWVHTGVYNIIAT